MPDTQTITDQLGRTVEVPRQPQRIVSLVPSQTELLFDLGLTTAEVVGRTKFCVHPAAQVADVASVGGTKKFRFDVIDDLQPDLIIGNKEENYQEGIAQLAAQYPVWLSDVRTLPQAYEMITAVGQLVNRRDEANGLVEDIQASFAQLQPQPRPWRVGYFIWHKPKMVVGADTFIHDLLGRCGLHNAFANLPGRYPEVTAEQIAAAHLDAVLLSSEPFPYTDKHRREYEALAQPTAVYLVDGELFSWYGSRLRHSVPYFQHLLAQLSS